MKKTKTRHFVSLYIYFPLYLIAKRKFCGSLKSTEKFKLCYQPEIYQRSPFKAENSWAYYWASIFLLFQLCSFRTKFRE